MRSSKGTPAAATSGVLKVSARLVERLAVTSGAVRLTTARFGMFMLEGSGLFTATSPSPPLGSNLPVAVKSCSGLLRYRPIAHGGIHLRVDGTRLHIVDRDARLPTSLDSAWVNSFTAPLVAE